MSSLYCGDLIPILPLDLDFLSSIAILLTYVVGNCWSIFDELSFGGFFIVETF